MNATFNKDSTGSTRFKKIKMVAFFVTKHTQTYYNGVHKELFKHLIQRI